MKTRMERYKELREKMSTEVNQEVQSHDLSQYANRLNKIDEDNFEDMNQTGPEYEPTRAKELDLKKYETFENEYLKDFLDEVKSYNIEKGNRLVEDTEQNILEEINAHKKVEPVLGTKEAPIGLEDLEALEAGTFGLKEKPAAPVVDEKIESVMSDSQAYNFDQMLEAVTSETALVNDETSMPEDDFLDESVEEVVVFTEAVEETVPVEETEVEAVMDTDSLIDSLQSGNFMVDNDVEPVVPTEVEDDIFANLRTFDLELEQEIRQQADEIFNQNTGELESLRMTSNENSKAKEENFEYEENFDPFWEDYLLKMNQLEDNIDTVFEQKRDTLNFPKDRVKKIVIENKDQEERDITQEFLALTREIERENLESIDLTGKTEEEMSVVNKDSVVTNDKSLNTQDDFGTSVVAGKEVKKNRFVNAFLTIALAGIVLGVAIAVKYFVLN